MTLDRRLLPGEDPGEVIARITESMTSLDPWRVDVIPGAMMYPSDLASDSETAKALKAVCAVAGISDAPCYSAASLDAGYLNHEGIETVMFGPGDLRFAHTDREIVPLEDVRLAARIYAATALTLLA